MGLKQQLRRTFRNPGKYTQAVWRWKRFSFDKAPSVFGNSKPKSGSHLLVQVLNGFTRIMPYAYVAAEPVRTISKNGRRKRPEEIASELRGIPKGVIGWGYVETSPDVVSVLCQPGRVNYFVYRDPRDMLVSQVFFATEMHEGHGMHDFYKSLPDFEERLKVAITGIDRNGLKMVSVKQRYEGVFEWLAQPEVMSIRYEDLINHRDATLNAMLDEVERTGYSIPTPRQRAVKILVEAIKPKKSRTFRSGTTGGWRDYFTDEHKRLFKDVAGDLVVRLGYEENNEW